MLKLAIQKYLGLVFLLGLLGAGVWGVEARDQVFTVTLVDGWSVPCDNIWKVHDMGPMGTLDAVGGTIVMDASEGFASAAIYILTGQPTDPTTIIVEGHKYFPPGEYRAQFTANMPAGTYVRVPGRLYIGAACSHTLTLYAMMQWTPRSDTR